MPPPEMTSQQQAELYALDAATRLGVRLGLQRLTLVGDNRAMLHLVGTMRPALRNQTLVRTVRRIRNRLLWSGLLLHLMWCPSALQPADPLSRCDISVPAATWRAATEASRRWDTMCDLWHGVEHVHTTQLRSVQPSAAAVADS